MLLITIVLKYLFSHPAVHYRFNLELIFSSFNIEFFIFKMLLQEIEDGLGLARHAFHANIGGVINFFLRLKFLFLICLNLYNVVIVVF